MQAEVLPPSALGAPELAVWQAMLAERPTLRRAFLAPGFARAVEAAHGEARVAVLHEGGAIRGFFAFQFASHWHRRVGLAERLGGELSDAAGLVAWPGVVVTPRDLMRLCRIGQMFVTHLMPGQAAHGLTAEASETGHVIDLSAGGAPYLARLNTDLLRDTARRRRRAERDFGALRFTWDAAPSPAAALAVIARKRAQYRRTQVADPFARAAHLRLMTALCDAPTPQCQPVLATLHAGDRLLAQHLGLLCDDVLSYWFPVYDPQAEKVSPGRLLLSHLIGEADQTQVRLIDRGTGDSPAKREFSTGTQAFGVANWSAGTARAMAARVFQAAAWRLG